MTVAPQPESLPDRLKDLLDAVAHELDHYMFFPSDHHAPAIALYSAYTHTAHGFDVAAYLQIHSPEPRCGKTLLLEILSGLVARPLSASNMTSAALFRTIEQRRPTVLFDEVDQIFPKRRAMDPGTRELQGIFNAGYRRGGRVFRIGGPRNQDVEEFEPFGPKVLAGIGDLPLTIADRCIPIRLQRKPRGTETHRFRYRQAFPRLQAYGDQFSQLLEQEDLLNRLSQAEPTLPEALHDRAQDIWEPLIALADEAGGHWPKRARAAAEALHSAGDEPEGSVGVQLLGDIKRVWPEPQAAMASREILGKLHGLEEAPWGEWNGRPITPHFLAKRLKPYGIYSGNRRIGEIQAKGYRRQDFKEAWSRYLPHNDELPSHPSQSLSQ